MPLSANLLKLGSSILPRAKRATNQNNVATEKRIKKKFWHPIVPAPKCPAPKCTRPQIIAVLRCSIVLERINCEERTLHSSVQIIKLWTHAAPNSFFFTLFFPSGVTVIRKIPGSAALEGLEFP